MSFSRSPIVGFSGVAQLAKHSTSGSPQDRSQSLASATHYLVCTFDRRAEDLEAAAILSSAEASSGRSARRFLEAFLQGSTSFILGERISGDKQLSLTPKLNTFSISFLFFVGSSCL